MQTDTHFFQPTVTGRFIERPNRFIVHCEIDGKQTRAYLPNPGKLRELFFPGVKLYLTHRTGGATSHTVAAVERDGRPVMLHTHINNDVAERLINDTRIPSFRGWKVSRREVKEGRSRFDFLLSKKGTEMLLEIKSCTLFGNAIAMFPDAVTARGTRHLLELAELSGSGRKTAVLFLVHTPTAKFFMPDYHTDIEFARTLIAVRNRVRITAAAITWNSDLSLGNNVHELQIPWTLIEREAEDRGSYIVLLRLTEEKQIETGALGKIYFRKGWYCYVGSAMKNLTSRIARHRAVHKTAHWHIDYLRRHSEFKDVFPVRAHDRLECAIAAEMKLISEASVDGFGCSDCSCTSHLFRFRENPATSREFMALVQRFRMDRLEQFLKCVPF